MIELCLLLAIVIIFWINPKRSRANHANQVEWELQKDKHGNYPSFESIIDYISGK